MIYSHFSLNEIRIKLNDEQTIIKLPSDFYHKQEDSNTLKMFYSDEVILKIKAFFKGYRDQLSTIMKLKNRFRPNNVLLLVDKSIEGFVTISDLDSFTLYSFDALNVGIIKEPKGFNNKELENLKTLRNKVINVGRFNSEVTLNNLK